MRCQRFGSKECRQRVPFTQTSSHYTHHVLSAVRPRVAPSFWSRSASIPRQNRYGTSCNRRVLRRAIKDFRSPSRGVGCTRTGAKRRSIFSFITHRRANRAWLLERDCSIAIARVRLLDCDLQNCPCVLLLRSNRSMCIEIDHTSSNTEGSSSQRER